MNLSSTNVYSTEYITLNILTYHFLAIYILFCLFLAYMEILIFGKYFSLFVTATYVIDF